MLEVEQLTFKTGKEKAVSLEVKKSQTESPPPPTISFVFLFQITQNANPAGSKTQI